MIMIPLVLMESTKKISGAGERQKSSWEGLGSGEVQSCWKSSDGFGWKGKRFGTSLSVSWALKGEGTALVKSALLWEWCGVPQSQSLKASSGAHPCEKLRLCCFKELRLSRCGAKMPEPL